MQIKDQIRARREQLGISVAELAKRVGVSGQAIRHWESGRSFPGKSKAPDVETALSFTLDWTEGRRVDAAQPQMAALVKQEDMDLLMLLCRLPAPFKALLSDLAKMQLGAIVGDKKAFSVRAEETPLQPFSTREKGNQVAAAAPRAAAKGKGNRSAKKASR